MFDSTDVTVLMNILKKYDPLLSRSEHADEDAISYYVRADISSEIMKAFAENAFGDVICDVDVIKKIKNDKVLKASIY